MPKWKYRRNNTWLTQGSSPSLSVSNASPATSGQTFALPFNFAFDTTDNSQVTSADLLYLNLAGDPVLLATTTTLTLGWVIPVPSNFTPGTYTFFGRVHTATNQFDGPQIVVTLTASSTKSISWQVPNSDGQTYQFPFTAAFAVSPSSSCTKVELWRSGGTKLGEATSDSGFGWTIAITDQLAAGTYTLFGRAFFTDGTVITGSNRSVTLSASTPPPVSGSRTLKNAIAYGGEDSHTAEAQARIGRKFQVRMRFVVRATPSGCLTDFGNQIDAVNARAGTDPYMMWLTVGLVMNNDSGGLLATANGDRNATLWEPMGDILDRCSATTIQNLVGLRLGHEFMNAGDDYRWGVRNTTVNTTNLLTNASRFVNAWRMAVNTMKSRLSTQAKKDALQLDWNSPGGQMIRTMTHLGGVNAWTLCDACYPGDAYVTHITTDIYNQERFRSNHTGSAPYVPINGPDSPLTYVRTRATSHGKKSGMSEGSAFMYKWKSGALVGTDDGAATVKFINDILDWGQTEANAGRLSHITFFERDPYNEGFTAFIGGQRDTSARSTGEERTWDLWRLLHPREAKTGGGFIPGGIPDYATGVPNTLSRRATAYTGVGGARSRSVHSNAPQALNRLLDRVGGP